MTSPETDAPTEPTSSRLVVLGVLLLCTGMMLVIAGVTVGWLFVPGVIVVGLGLLVVAAAALLQLRLPSPS